ncbi:hypothetical protein [Cedecea sp. MMO-103]|uniref:hypothetical protein n=1 Tax=Cedecea sp. MMO-103 TaxID=3081238 RepID=UPI0030166840
MNSFSRTRAMHQYYRDLFTRAIHLPEADALPAWLVTEVLNFANPDFAALDDKLNQAQTGLNLEQDRALKLMMGAIILSNVALCGPSGEKSQAVDAENVEKITQCIVEALKLDGNKNYLVAAVQILFRINEINSAVFLISNNLSELSESPVALKILLLICLMEEDFNQAYVIIQQLTENMALIGEDPMALLMVVTAIYKLGGRPDSFIDFSPLDVPDWQPDAGRYSWLIEPVNNNKTTVLVACDGAGFTAHGLPLLLSLFDTNRDELNVHFHIYNCDAGLAQQITGLRNAMPELAISLSSEAVTPGTAANVHYASRRLVFLSHALEKMTTPVLLLEANSLVRKSWAGMEGQLDVKDLLLTWDETAPFWASILAACLYCEGGELSTKYLAAVARFIDRNLQRNNAERFLDQVALAAVENELSALDKMAIGRAQPHTLVDAAHGEDAFSWILAHSGVESEDYRRYKASLLEKYSALIG